jgi:hypothetical protein
MVSAVVKWKVDAYTYNEKGSGKWSYRSGQPQCYFR